MKKLLALLALILVVGFGGFELYKAEAPSASFGAAAGPDHYNHENFFLNLTRGGLSTVATSSSMTLLAHDIVDVSRVNFVPGAGSLTATLPATSTLTAFIPKPGDTQDVLLCNATTTVSTPFTLAAGTGMTFSDATTTLAVQTGKCAQLQFSRRPTTDIDVFVDIGS